MTDIITKARKEWCETYLVEFDSNGDEIPVDYSPCPPEVVAALLNVLAHVVKQDPPMSYGGREALLAEAAIARALEQKL